MDKKISEIEVRMNNLEERLKFVFGEIEKRLDQAKPHEEYTTEERIQELEDLLLLLQLENTKIREKVGETSIDFGITAAGPDVISRLNRIEEELGRGNNLFQPHAGQPEPKAVHFEPKTHPDTDSKFAALEEKIRDLHESHSAVKLPKDAEKHVRAAVQEEVRDLEKRVKTLEALMEKRGKDEIDEADSDVLSDIQKILKR